MLRVLRQRNFALLWTGGLISGLGDWFLFIALPFYIYDLTGSALATGGMFITETLPSILFGSLAGVFVDRWDRRWTMVAADLSRALLLLLLLTARSPDTVWIIFVVTFAQSTIGQFFGPARGALIPRLVADGELVTANALTSTTSELNRLIGPALGGALMGALGFGTVVLLDAASFLFSALMILAITAPRLCRSSPATTESGSWRKVWSEFATGLQLIRASPTLRPLLVVLATFMVGQGIINVLLIPFVKDVLHGDALVLGWIASAQGVGGLIGGLAISHLGRPVPPARLIAIGFIATGLLLIAVVHVTGLLPVLALIAVIGLAVVGVNVGVQTLLQQTVADEYRGRVFGTVQTIQSSLLLVGMALAGALGGRLGIVALVDLAGLLTALAGVLAASSLASTSAPVDRPRAPVH